MIRVGSFYEIFDNDALIMNHIFHYKIKTISNTFKVGFPVKNIEMITRKLKSMNLNYVVVDNDFIIDSYQDKNNAYNNYSFDRNILYYQTLRIDKIIKNLEENRLNLDFNEKLRKIEEVLKFS